jgi:hypothetical protein
VYPPLRLSPHAVRISLPSGPQPECLGLKSRSNAELVIDAAIFPTLFPTSAPKNASGESLALPRAATFFA